MTDPNNLNRPSLKYSNYFKNPPPASRPGPEANSIQAIEKATWILLILCCIPFVGGLFALATVILGVILVTRNRLAQGLIAIIAAPVASTAISIFIFIHFIAAAGVSASQQFERQLKESEQQIQIQLQRMQAAAQPNLSLHRPPSIPSPRPTSTPRIKASEASINGAPVK